MNEYNSNNNYNSNYSANNNGYNPYDQGSMNEFTYNPNRKRSKGKKILTGVVAVLCVAAIGTTSIVGYNLVTGKNFVGTSNSNSAVAKEQSKDKTADSIDRSNLPTIEQLSTPSDALSIPEIVKKVSPSVVGISCILDGGTATGSGIIMSEDGYIVTNAHVVDGARSISVVLPDSYNGGSPDSSEISDDNAADGENPEDNLTYTAVLVGKDSQSDIAVLKIDAKDLAAAEFGTSADLQVGEASIVIGNPLGFSLANSVTAGIISATDRTLTVEDRTMNLIQTDASINSGNSGGPLINAYGQVIGITSAKVSSSVGEGLGFAIPIDEALPIIDDLMKNGYVTGRPSLGLSGSDITSAYSSYYGLPQGFLVRSVTEGSGAEKAGIQENDIIIGINGTVITSISELNEIKNKCKVGDTVELTIYRNKKMINVDVVLGESTGETAEPSEDDQSQQYNGYNGYDYYNGYGDGLNGYNFGYGF